MDQNVIKELSTADLRDRLEDETKQLVKLRINHAVSPLENPNKLKAYRKIIARIKTELRKRELEESNKKQ
ncbi:MAG TPA: 50S ribosomal protein L29 [Bacteroidales bacterium]|nr:50S ribosomal protein L29 [Bacteroidales bacterium]HPE56482.1 50S ribosomal protein L29 [Bacteroidales bacterium]HRX95735.1 50S ribosomal protein L29 [Bacteroidales bacterium]